MQSAAHNAPPSLPDSLALESMYRDRLFGFVLFELRFLLDCAIKRNVRSRLFSSTLPPL
jgi:hypothetical protein